MTIDQLRQSLLDQLQAADQETARLQAELRAAELRAAFLRGKLDLLGQIQIEERPTYTHGEEAPAAA